MESTFRARFLGYIKESRQEGHPFNQKGWSSKGRKGTSNLFFNIIQIMKVLFTGRLEGGVQEETGWGL